MMTGILKQLLWRAGCWDLMELWNIFTVESLDPVKVKSKK